MRIFRNRVRVSIIVLCALTPAAMGIGLARPLGPAIPSALSRTAQTDTIGVRDLPAANGKLGLQTCPPAVIHGTLGTGSPDYPFVTGVQTGRLSQNGVDSTCAAPKSCPGIAPGGAGSPFTFDSYEFVNDNSSSACVTFSFPTGCGVNNAVHPVAYLGSFDPANPCTNYLGDIGHSINISTSGAFSVNVPANSTVVLVVHEVGSQPGCQGYSFSVTGLPQCLSCPPETITGSIGKGSSDYPSTSGVQTGRVSQNGVDSTCAAPKACPGIAPVGAGSPFTFDSYAFVNDSSSAACVTFTFPTACGVNNAVHPVAYLGSFDPANPCTNYLGDIGHSINQSEGGAFSVNVPANSTVVLVVHEVGSQPGCLGYSFSVTGLPQCLPCPPETITGDIGLGSSDYPSTSGVQTGRLSQNGVDSTCAAPKTCPGIAPVGAGSPFTFDSYEFVNDSSSAACVTFTFPTGCAVNNAVHPVAYLGSFDPANPCTNYLGDIGHSINQSEGGAFSVNVPANSTVVLVVHEVGTQPGCQGYSFSVTGLPCQLPCTLTCPSNITQPNEANQCGALVNFSAPTTSGDCGAVTCDPASGSFFPSGTTTVTCTEDSSSINCSFTVTINDTQPPTITCPANITTSNDPNQCGSVVNYSAPAVSDNCPNVGAPVCSPASGSFFPVGTTTVSCTVADASPNSPDSTCTFAITVNDTQPPVITCPANITSVTDQNVCPSPGCTAVTYPSPVATDNCPGVGVVCNPPSGSCFAVGVTTVTCTATDASGNTATCSFSVSVFDTALQDDGNPSTILVWNSITGQYRFCCNGITFTGIGKATRQGCVYTLQHNPADRRVLGRVDKSVHSGSASIQAPAGTTRCTISDRTTLNDTLTPPCQ
jgi:HYR domain